MMSGIFQVNLKLLVRLGLWSSEHREGWKYYTSYIFIRAVTILHIYQVTVMWGLDCYYNIDEPLFICQNIVFMGMSGLLIATSLTFILQPTRMKNVVASLEEISDNSQMDDDYQKHLRVKSKKYLDITALFCFDIGLIGGVWFHLSATRNHLITRTPFTRGWFPFDIKESPYLELSMLQQSIAGISLNIILCVGNVFILAIIAQTIVQFKIVRYQLVNIRKLSLQAVRKKYAEQESSVKAEQECSVNAEQEGTVTANWDLVERRILPSKPRLEENVLETGVHAVMPREDKVQDEEQDIEQEMERRLKACIKHHQALLGLASEIQTAFNWFYFIHLACNLIPAGCVAVFITKVPAMNDDAWGVVNTLGCTVVNLLVHCAVSDYLTSESNAMKEAAYECSWLESSDSFKRSLCIIMSMANQPSVISIANFIPLSLPTFKNITEKSYSYYMALLSVSESMK